MKIIQLSILFIVICSGFASAAVSVGNNLNLTETSMLVFPDGSIQSTALSQGLPGPIGLTGPAGPAGTPGVTNVLPLTRQIISYDTDVTNTWLTNDTWLDLTGDVYFLVHADGNYIKVDFDLNIGAFSNNWCSLSLWLDTFESQPRCVRSWSGVSGTSTFNNSLFTCVVPSMPAGLHTFKIKHKSGYCHYFNGPEQSVYNNLLFIQELSK